VLNPSRIDQTIKPALTGSANAETLNKTPSEQTKYTKNSEQSVRVSVQTKMHKCKNSSDTYAIKDLSDPNRLWIDGLNYPKLTPIKSGSISPQLEIIDNAGEFLNPNRG